MEHITLVLIAVVLIIQVIVLIKRSKYSDERQLENAVQKVTKEILAQTVNEHRALREELDGKIDRLKDSQYVSISEFSKNISDSLEKIRLSIDERMRQSIETQSKSSNELKDSLISTINEFRQVQQNSLEKIRVTVDDKLGQSIESQSRKLSELTANNTTSMDSIRNKVDERLDQVQKKLEEALGTLQISNEKKLEEMRMVVNEKLEKTLETRLQKSFETVSIQLESVNKGLGEMKTVAESVGSLNRMLSNAKSRGILGELQLGQIIEDMLPSHLYDIDVSTVSGSRERVEYAIKLPGTEEGKHVYLPIDSKFPLEDYARMLDGYEAGDKALIESSRKALYARIKSFAKDVTNKYVSPPETTNFALLFLPTEGLYAEIARDSVLFNSLRQDGITVVGPTTLSAMLNSLQVGFKTLQIQKGAADIEKTLGSVKKEFENFEGVLNKAHERITQAGSEIETLVGKRTRAINRSLRGVQTYTGEDAQRLLGISEDDEI